MKTSYKILFATVLATVWTNAFGADVSGLATTNYVKGAIESIQPTLNAMQTTENIVNPIGTDEEPGFNPGDMGSTTKYPSMKAAEQIAAMVVSENATEVDSKISDLETGLSTLEQKVEDALGDIDGSLGGLAAKDQVETADITDGAVTADKIADDAVTAQKIADGLIAAGTNISVSRNESNGVVTVTNTYSLPNANGATLGGVKTGGDMTASDGTLTIASNAVTSAKIADDAITTGKIKGYDTGECSGTNCALVDLGGGAVWLPIVNEYTAN